MEERKMCFWVAKIQSLPCFSSLHFAPFSSINYLKFFIPFLHNRLLFTRHLDDKQGWIFFPLFIVVRFIGLCLWNLNIWLKWFCTGLWVLCFCFFSGLWVLYFICRQPFVDIVVTKCKHYFCEHCALKVSLLFLWASTTSVNYLWIFMIKFFYI